MITDQHLLLAQNTHLKRQLSLREQEIQRLRGLLRAKDLPRDYKHKSPWKDDEHATS
jgi:hypothetical protein